MHYLESFSLSLLKSLSDDPRVESLRDIEVGLLQQLSDNQHIGGGTISRDVILCVEWVGVEVCELWSGWGKCVRVEWVELTWAVATLAISEAVGCWICCKEIVYFYFIFFIFLCVWIVHQYLYQY